MGEGFIVLRLDGRSFHTLTKPFEKPFDERIELAMEETSRRLMVELPEAQLAYVQSDEITLVLAAGTQLFDRRLEKLLSVSAGIASSAFALSLRQLAVFDARLLLAPGPEDVMAILAERQQDSLKNCASTCAYWALRARGESARAANRRLAGVGMRGRMELLAELGIAFNDVSSGRRRGRTLRYQVVVRPGYNPRTKQTVEARRRVLTWDREIADYRFADPYPELLTADE